MNTDSSDFPVKILVQFAHPVIHKSRVNKALLAAISDLPGITINNLYNQYPDLDIEVAAEQKRVTAADIIVFQHPLFWYSPPPIIKEWEDLVLEHGWAFGRNGHALRGKKVLFAISTGGTEATYQHDGHNRYTIRDFLRPLEQAFYLCGVAFISPFVVHGTHMLENEDVTRHANNYRRILEALRDDKIDFDAAGKSPRLNSNLDAVIKP